MGGITYNKDGFAFPENSLIYIHVSPTDLKKLQADGKGNLIITGHIASDSVGITPFIRELEKKGISVTKLGITTHEEKIAI